MKKIISLLLVSALSLGMVIHVSAETQDNFTFEEALECMVVEQTFEGLEVSFPCCDVSKNNFTQDQIEELHTIALQRLIGVEGQNVSEFSDIFDELEIQPLGRPTHVTEHGSSVRRTFGGFAGNQPPEGTRLKQPGGFFYSDSGGPSVSLSIGFSSPFNSMSVSVSLGNKSSSGQYISVPNTTNFFKLYVEKTYDCKPYIVWAVDSRGQKTKYASGVSKVHINTSLDVKKVK